MEPYSSLLFLPLICCAGIYLKSVQCGENEFSTPASEWHHLITDQAIPLGLVVSENDKGDKRQLSTVGSVNAGEGQQDELKKVMQEMMEEGTGQATSAQELMSTALYPLATLITGCPAGRINFHDDEIPIIKKEIAFRFLGELLKELLFYGIYFGILGLLFGIIVLYKYLTRRSPTSKVTPTEFPLAV